MTQRKRDHKILDIVTEWPKRFINQQRTFAVILTIILIIAVIICDIGFFWFKNNNYERILAQNINFIEDSTLQEANTISQKLNKNVTLVENLARQYEVVSAFEPDASILENLQKIADDKLFDRIGYLTEDGTDITLTGTAVVSDREYFKKGMSGQSGFEFIPKSRVTHEPTMIFYAPIRSDGKVTGVMVGFYNMKSLDKLFTYKVLNIVPDSYLLKKDGTVVASSLEDESNDNMLDFLKDKKFYGDVDYDDLIAAIADTKRTLTHFTFEEYGTNTIGVISQFDGSDMMVLSILPGTITTEMASNADHAGTMFIIAVSVAFAMLVILFVGFLIYQRRKMSKEMAIAQQNARDTILYEQQQSFVIESLGNTYSSIYFVDVTSGTYERIAEREYSVLNIPNVGEWSIGYPSYVNNFVDKAYRDDMMIFCDLNAYAEQLDGGDRISVEYQRNDLGWRKAVMIPADHDDDGNIVSVIFAVQNTAKEKKKELDTKKALQEAYEAAQLASTAKTAFLSNMSHDIRTPMNAIVGMTAIAAANIENTEKVSDCLKKITVSSKHLLGLINEVLDMSKIESGNIDLCEEEFNLPDLIDELITINQPLIKEKHHTLSVKISGVDHERVIGDSTRLQQVFTNLLTNAIKYTPADGNIEISLTEKQTNKNSIGWYEVVFRDNGIGMTEEFRKKIFEPFSRARDSRIASIQGTGLGMPIARNIVRMMNGDITVESEIDKGSTFTVSFALRLQHDEDATVDYAKFIDLPVLVADDDVVTCESTCTILNSLSMKSEYVLSGESAVERTVARHDANDDYYAIIIDWKMPGMSGVDTAREIRRRVGDSIPIIVISAYDWTDIEKEAKEAGVNAFLSKPLFKSRIVKLFSDLVTGDGDAPVKASEIRKHDFTGKRVLLAEDNELNSEIAVEILSMTGLEVDTAEDGKACVDAFTASAPGYYDLIFMDIQMPVMNGYEATRAIRASAHPDATTVPIVAMTANAFSTDVRAAFDAGMNGHISKPIDVATVLKTLEEHIK